MLHWFIGDVHGKVDAVETALSKEGRKIFVGDFIDSYDHPIEDHRKCYELVLNAIENGEPVECIYGNHELSYLMPRQHRCSGFDYSRSILMKEFETRIRQYFKPFIFIAPDFLVSHAGLTKQIWLEERLSHDVLPQVLAEWWPNPDSPMHWIGNSRGGGHPQGGMFWCDWSEFQPIQNLTQVFGHTRGQSIRQKDNSFCIDCLDSKAEFLSLDVPA